MSLIPEIVIGKRYLWKSSPIESLCPKCGANMGNSAGEYHFEVVVLGKEADYSEPVKCNNCEADQPVMQEGWYIVKDEARPWFIGSVPYTQLEEIEESEDNIRTEPN